MSFPDPWALTLRKRQVPLPPGEGRGEQEGAERPQILDLSPSFQVGLASATQSGIPGFLATPTLPSPLLLVELVLPGCRVHQCAHLCPAPTCPEHMAQALGGGSVLAEHVLALNGHSHYGLAS